MRFFWSALLIASTSCRAFPSSSSSSSYPLSSLLQMNMSSSSSNSNSSNDFNQAKQRISQAISIGAPAYNAGDIKKCADVYTDAAKDIAPLLPSSFRTKLLQEVDQNENNTPEDDATTDYNAKAWALRRVFDSITDYLPPLVPQDATTTDENITYDPFTKSQLGNEPLAVMDNVMGGISHGSWISKTNTFFGETSLANNGGFASLRWRFPNAQNWSYARGIYITGLRHSHPEEHTFRIILKDASCERVRLANYKTVFANPGQRKEGGILPLLIPFSAFGEMEQMGRGMVGSPPFNPMHVTEIGIMAIKPTVVGEFQLEFEEWGLYM